MATQFSFRCTEVTVGATPEILQVTSESSPRHLQILIKKGSATLEGSSGSILGVPVSPYNLVAGEKFDFSEKSYKDITITLAPLSVYALFANE